MCLTNRVSSLMYFCADTTVAKELNQAHPIREQMLTSARPVTTAQHRPQNPRSVPRGHSPTPQSWPHSQTAPTVPLVSTRTRINRESALH